MACLDLRSINLGSANILTFATKKLAKEHPLPHFCYIAEAANRFWRFYVIVRKAPNEPFEIMLKNGEFRTCERRYLVGDKSYIEES